MALRNNKLYNCLANIKGRCYNPNHRDYKYYGAKGIILCDEWLNSFNCFEQWALNNGYKSGLSLDRINVNGPYSPDNCRWVEWKLQARNKNQTIYVEGLSLKEYCELHNLPYTTIFDRYRRHNWTLEEAIKTPIGNKRGEYGL